MPPGCLAGVLRWARVWSYGPAVGILEGESAHPCAFAVHGLDANAAFDVVITNAAFDVVITNAADHTVNTLALDADGEGTLAIDLRTPGRHFVCVRFRSAKE